MQSRNGLTSQIPTLKHIYMQVRPRQQTSAAVLIKAAEEKQIPATKEPKPSMLLPSILKVSFVVSKLGLEWLKLSAFFFLITTSTTVTTLLPAKHCHHHSSLHLLGLGLKWLSTVIWSSLFCFVSALVLKGGFLHCAPWCDGAIARGDRILERRHQH